MNQHRALVKVPAKRSKSRGPALSKLQTLVRSAKQAGRVVGKTGTLAASSLKQEEPQTIAKMVLAAMAPKLMDAALRFAIRNPVVTVLGVVVVAAVASSLDEPDTAPA